MAIWNFGSINADHFYLVSHIPSAGETISASGLTYGLGGKGANQSVSAAQAGSKTHHIGAVGADGAWAVERLESYGVDVTHVVQVQAPTGHAIINVAEDGENAIVILAGANADQPIDHVLSALAQAAPGDFLMLQNETAHQPEIAKAAKNAGLKVVYSAAPFDAFAVREVMEHLHLLIMNEVEAEQLFAALDTYIAALPVPHILITKGDAGADWRDNGAAKTFHQPIYRVEVVDTTGAGDTFAGYVVAALDQGISVPNAMKLASAAAALKVTKRGTADAIPRSNDVVAFIKSLKKG